MPDEKVNLREGTTVDRLQEGYVPEAPLRVTQQQKPTTTNTKPTPPSTPVTTKVVVPDEKRGYVPPPQPRPKTDENR